VGTTDFRFPSTAPLLKILLKLSSIYMIISIFGSGLGLVFDQIFRIGTSELQIAGLAEEKISFPIHVVGAP
jgi:hypothetical protein